MVQVVREISSLNHSTTIFLCYFQDVEDMVYDGLNKSCGRYEQVKVSVLLVARKLVTFHDVTYLHRVEAVRGRLNVYVGE